MKLKNYNKTLYSFYFWIPILIELYLKHDSNNKEELNLDDYLKKLYSSFGGSLLRNIRQDIGLIVTNDDILYDMIDLTDLERKNKIFIVDSRYGVFRKTAIHNYFSLDRFVKINKKTFYIYMSPLALNTTRHLISIGQKTYYSDDLLLNFIPLNIEKIINEIEFIIEKRLNGINECYYFEYKNLCIKYTKNIYGMCFYFGLKKIINYARTKINIGPVRLIELENKIFEIFNKNFDLITKNLTKDKWQSKLINDVLDYLIEMKYVYSKDFLKYSDLIEILFPGEFVSLNRLEFYGSTILSFTLNLDLSYSKSLEGVINFGVFKEFSRFAKQIQISKVKD